MIATIAPQSSRHRTTVCYPQSDLGESIELLSPIDSNKTNNNDKVSEYHPFSEENSAEILPFESSGNSSSIHTGSTTETEVSNEGNNSNIRSIDLSERIVNRLDEGYDTD